ncbi:MAG TPA: FG-GAP repeat protein, partial [Pyrinomonadaceae bacterium]|nr:FG-GAP repeat protein [Pyrinomonadaceae bacterium]
MNRIKHPLVVISIMLSFVALSVAYNRTGSARPAVGSELLKLHGQDAGEAHHDRDLSQPLAATGAFVEEARLLADDGASQDSMGFSVSVSGDTAVVGAPADAVNSKNRQGSAYVYVRTGTTWTQQQKLTSSDGAANDEFGYSVAVAGDTIAVGRHNTQVGSNRTRGAVYIFKRTGATWTEQQILTANDGVEGDVFGSSLALENDTLVVGALQKNIGSNFFQGAAYVFTRSSGGASFAQQARLTADDGGFADFFGHSVAVSGDTAIVGAVGLAGAGAAGGRGWVYVYVRSGAAWTQQQKLLASDGASGDAFGFSVGISGDTAIIGARADVVGSAGEVGSAYIFTRAGAAWTEQQKLT